MSQLADCLSSTTAEFSFQSEYSVSTALRSSILGSLYPKALTFSLKHELFIASPFLVRQGEIDIRAHLHTRVSAPLSPADFSTRRRDSP